MKHNTWFNLLLALGLVLALGGGISMARQAQAQGPGLQGNGTIQGTSLGAGFTYQGRLTDNSGTPTPGPCTLRFTLYDAASGTGQIGTPQTKSGVTLNDGYFTVEMDFGAGAFNGDARYLKIEVNCGSGYTTLSPRQALTAAPYAHFAKTIYRRTVVVSPVGTATENGAALLNALTGITGASVNNPYLLKIEPGVYDLGTSSLQMKEGVDVEGSGEKTTTITASGYATYTLGTVMGASNTELRFLSVTNTGGVTNPYAIAIYYGSAVSAKITHVTASASMGPSNIAIRNKDSSPIMTNVTVLAGGLLCDVSIGVWNDNSAPTMTDVYIYASDGTQNYGVMNINNSAPTMTNVDVTATMGTDYCAGVRNTDSGATIRHSVISSIECMDNYGVLNDASSGLYTVVIQNSQVSAYPYTIQNNTGYTTNIGASQLEWGTVNIVGGSVVCAGCYDQDYTFYPSTCP